MNHNSIMVSELITDARRIEERKKGRRKSGLLEHHYYAVDSG